MWEKILAKKPFSLNAKQQAEIVEMFSKMSIDEKIGQLFLLVAGAESEEEIKEKIKKYNPGGFMYRPLGKDKVFEMHQLIQQQSKIPAFLAANTEAGGDGLAQEGTHVGSNMQVAATNDPSYGYKQGEIAGKELRALGGNLSFAPVVDINMEWRNPIANLRAYSDDVETVRNFAVQNVLGTQAQGAAVSVKHFPGDGVDSRDHHVSTSMNHLNLKEWMASFGKVYSDCFDAGALTTMVGHFAVPYLVEDLQGPESDKFVPTSWNKTVLQKLLREKLDFNGLVLTDATLMTGMIKYGYPRSKIVPLAIENGCDVFLFVRDLAEDFNSMKKGYEEGILTEKRLNEAVIRILATKMKLNLFNDLHLDKNNLKIVGCKEHQEVALDVAKKSITLVRNWENIFPLKNIKKVLLIPFLKANLMSGGGGNPTLNKIVEKFAKENIEVIVKDYASNPEQGFIDAQTAISKLESEYDAIFYFSDLQPMSNSAALLVEWKAFVGMDAPSLISDIPTIWISLGSPYHLFDVPNIPTLVNAYFNNDLNLNILFDKMMGRDKFIGVSPVDCDVSYPKYHVKKTYQKRI